MIPLVTHVDYAASLLAAELLSRHDHLAVAYARNGDERAKMKLVRQLDSARLERRAAARVPTAIEALEEAQRRHRIALVAVSLISARDMSELYETCVTASRYHLAPLATLAALLERAEDGLC